MRVVATEYISLDGVFEEPGVWSGPWFGEECGQFKDAELQASDALLLGRKTYEGFAAAWPKMIEETGDFGVKMNTMPKYVVSATLDKVEWDGAVLLEGDPVEAIRELRQQPGNDLLLSGSAQVFNAAHAAGLIDLYRFMVYPVVLGRGARLFADGLSQVDLKKVATKTLDGAVTILEFERA